jgi:TP53 regulating kinase and related kinases
MADASERTSEATQKEGSATPQSQLPKETFAPDDGWALISQGAEARLWKIPDYRQWCLSRRLPVRANAWADEDETKTKSPMCGAAAVAKERFSKSYRHPKLDDRLTSQRCRMEAKILQKCARRPDLLRVPAVLAVEAPVLYLEFLPFPTLRQHLDDVLASEPAAEDSHAQSRSAVIRLATAVGSVVSNLHYGLGVVHGDLTTSNFLIDTSKDKENGKEAQNNCEGVVTGGATSGHAPRSNDEPDAAAATTSNSNPLVLIDFGLAKNTESAEERAVDLYVLERALLSTHPQLPDSFFDEVLAAYGRDESDGDGCDGGMGGGKSGTSAPDRSRSAPAKRKATLARLEQVRLRGRKRECFG